MKKRLYKNRGNGLNIVFSRGIIDPANNVSDSTVLYSDISSNITGTNIMMFSIDLTYGVYPRYSIGFNGTWLYTYNHYSTYRSVLFWDRFTTYSASYSITLKSKTGEFTYTPPSGFIGIDDNI